MFFTSFLFGAVWFHNRVPVGPDVRTYVPGHELLLVVQQSTQGVLARKPPGGPREAIFFPIYALIYARKPSNEVRLNASRTSKRRVSCLETSWRRHRVDHTYTPEVRSSSDSMLLAHTILVLLAYSEYQNVPTNEQLWRILESPF